MHKYRMIKMAIKSRSADMAGPARFVITDANTIVGLPWFPSQIIPFNACILPRYLWSAVLALQMDGDYGSVLCVILSPREHGHPHGEGASGDDGVVAAGQ
jgi:hypothetical protein